LIRKCPTQKLIIDLIILKIHDSLNILRDVVCYIDIQSKVVKYYFNFLYDTMCLLFMKNNMEQLTDTVF